MALKETNKSRVKRKDIEWKPLYNLARKETEADVYEVLNYWKPLDRLAKKEFSDEI